MENTRAMNAAAAELGVTLEEMPQVKALIQDMLHSSSLPPGWHSEFDAAKFKWMYTDSNTGDVQYEHPLVDYYRGAVFMGEGGGYSQLLSNESIRPPNPTEEVAQMALSAPLPDGWIEEGGDNPVFRNVESGETQPSHPLDAYFSELIRRRRYELAENTPKAAENSKRAQEHLTQVLGPEFIASPDISGHDTDAVAGPMAGTAGVQQDSDKVGHDTYNIGHDTGDIGTAGEQPGEGAGAVGLALESSGRGEEHGEASERSPGVDEGPEASVGEHLAGEDVAVSLGVGVSLDRQLDLGVSLDHQLNVGVSLDHQLSAEEMAVLEEAEGDLPLEHQLSRGEGALLAEGYEGISLDHQLSVAERDLLDEGLEMSCGGEIQRGVSPVQAREEEVAESGELKGRGQEEGLFQEDTQERLLLGVGGMGQEDMRTSSVEEPGQQGGSGARGERKKEYGVIEDLDDVARDEHAGAGADAGKAAKSQGKVWASSVRESSRGINAGGMNYPLPPLSPRHSSFSSTPEGNGAMAMPASNRQSGGTVARSSAADQDPPAGLTHSPRSHSPLIRPGPLNLGGVRESNLHGRGSRLLAENQDLLMERLDGRSLSPALSSCGTGEVPRDVHSAKRKSSGDKMKNELPNIAMSAVADQHSGSPSTPTQGSSTGASEEAGATPERIMVAVRTKPLTGFREIFAWDLDETNHTMQLRSEMGRKEGAGRRCYKFDKVFGPDKSTAQLFTHHVKPVVDSALQGFNCTVFGYGQTGSGKTYTLFGPTMEDGVIGLAMVHIYKLRDLLVAGLSPQGQAALKEDQAPLSITDDPRGGTRVRGLLEVPIPNYHQAGRLVAFGASNRAAASCFWDIKQSVIQADGKHGTERRVKSQPHHRALQYRGKGCQQQPADAIEARDASNNQLMRTAVLNFVDLAGSERTGKTGATGQSFTEGTNINKSLLMLGQVVARLAEGRKGDFIPYRNSKLTRLLQPCLGGNARTAVVANINPCHMHIDESFNTLAFAQRSMAVVNEVAVNRVLDAGGVLVASLRHQVSELKQALDEARTAGTGSAALSHTSSAADSTFEDALKSIGRLLGKAPPSADPPHSSAPRSPLPRGPGLKTIRAMISSTEGNASISVQALVDAVGKVVEERDELRRSEDLQKGKVASLEKRYMEELKSIVSSYESLEEGIHKLEGLLAHEKRYMEELKPIEKRYMEELKPIVSSYESLEEGIHQLEGLLAHVLPPYEGTLPLTQRLWKGIDAATLLTSDLDTLQKELHSSEVLAVASDRRAAASEAMIEDMRTKTLKQAEGDANDAVMQLAEDLELQLKYTQEECNAVKKEFAAYKVQVAAAHNKSLHVDSVKEECNAVKKEFAAYKVQVAAAHNKSLHVDSVEEECNAVKKEFAAYKVQVAAAHNKSLHVDSVEVKRLERALQEATEEKDDLKQERDDLKKEAKQVGAATAAVEEASRAVAAVRGVVLSRRTPPTPQVPAEEIEALRQNSAKADLASAAAERLKDNVGVLSRELHALTNERDTLLKMMLQGSNLPSGIGPSGVEALGGAQILGGGSPDGRAGGNGMPAGNYSPVVPQDVSHVVFPAPPPDAGPHDMDIMGPGSLTHTASLSYQVPGDYGNFTNNAQLQNQGQNNMYLQGGFNQPGVQQGAQHHQPAMAGAPDGYTMPRSGHEAGGSHGSHGGGELGVSDSHYPHNNYPPDNNPTNNYPHSGGGGASANLGSDVVSSKRSVVNESEGGGGPGGGRGQTATSGAGKDAPSAAPVGYQQMLEALLASDPDKRPKGEEMASLQGGVQAATKLDLGQEKFSLAGLSRGPANPANMGGPQMRTTHQPAPAWGHEGPVPGPPSMPPPAAQGSGPPPGGGRPGFANATLPNPNFRSSSAVAGQPHTGMDMHDLAGPTNRLAATQPAGFLSAGAGKAQGGYPGGVASHHGQAQGGYPGGVAPHHGQAQEQWHRAVGGAHPEMASASGYAPVKLSDKERDLIKLIRWNPVKLSDKEKDLIKLSRVCPK
eukprot:gene21065-27945_t